MDPTLSCGLFSLLLCCGLHYLSFGLLILLASRGYMREGPSGRGREALF